MSDSVINVRALHKPLADAGLVPPGCALLDIAIGASGAVRVRYEVLYTPAQVKALGLVLAQAADEALEPRDEETRTDV